MTEWVFSQFAGAGVALSAVALVVLAGSALVRAVAAAVKGWPGREPGRYDAESLDADSVTP